MKELGFKVLLSLCSLSVGFGVSQLSLASEVHVSSAKVTAFERRIEDEVKRLDGQDAQMRTLLAASMSLQQEQVKQATELITLIRIQNQMNTIK